MAHFQGELKGNRGETTRQGTRTSGIQTKLMAPNGALVLRLFVDNRGRNCYQLRETKHWNSGREAILAEGVVNGSLLP